MELWVELRGGVMGGAKGWSYGVELWGGVMGGAKGWSYGWS